MEYEVVEIFEDETTVHFKFHTYEYMITYLITMGNEEKDVFDPYWGHDTKYTGRKIVEDMDYSDKNSITEKELKELFLEEEEEYSDILEEIFEEVSETLYSK